eukprot:TRINITY_DN7053_c0_g1_i1.p1 TRINITY_DN7053_c0_g1~~TRINITY_DN7053_c0_g1_i1.p1  ORF type:complete len:718 (-),score=181.78 TRINITY_DN7053_c0_g1_i1:51-1958(-)
MVGIIRIDGVPYSFLGVASPKLQNMTQTSLTVFPTRTVYTFVDASSLVQLTVTFMSPSLPTNLEVFARPLTYVVFDVVSTSASNTHDVQIYFDVTGQLAVNTVEEEITWSRSSVVNSVNDNLNVMQIGTTSQNYFDIVGDGVGIDWGYAFVSAIDDGSNSQSIWQATVAREMFISNGSIPDSDDTNYPRSENDNEVAMIVMWTLPGITNSNTEKYLMISYDDIFSIQYFGVNLPAYWRRYGEDGLQLIANASRDYANITTECSNYDQMLLNDLNARGGAEYATIGALAFRQCFAASKLVWHPTLETTWMFMKEISSDGDLSTVDVIYPASPLFLYQNPQLLQWLLVPIMAYANNETSMPSLNYTLEWAPHHLGYYPVGNIQVSQQENMPVEETGNMILMITGVAMALQDTSFFYPHYWPLLEQWGNYLTTALPDPGNQLCTDDFEGPSPHNANLAAKGIVALEAFAKLCRMVGRSVDYDYFHYLSLSYAARWMELANDTNHYRLEYDLANTWSLKYNIAYQYILGLQVYNESVIEEELDYYQTKYNPFGVPLDDRANFTKLDWMSWIAAMVPDDGSSPAPLFSQLIGAIYDFANETPNRVPLSDWYETTSGAQVGFQARSVVGGVYAAMLFRNDE